jgi:hypothetical protein
MDRFSLFYIHEYPDVMLLEMKQLFGLDRFIQEYQKHTQLHEIPIISKLNTQLFWKYSRSMIDDSSPLSRFQSITRELNFVVEEHVRTGELARHIDATHPWIHDVHVDSIFRDEAKI